MEPEVIVDNPYILGENPLWNHIEQKLYWTDITGQGVYRIDPTTRNVETVFSGKNVGGFTFQTDGSLLLFMERGMVATLRNNQFDTVLVSLPDEIESRFNDVITDPEGRVFCGTMPSPDHLGALYLLETDGSINKVVENVGISNGLGFSPDLKNLYYVDTPTKRIDIFNYDCVSGKISNRRIFANTDTEPGIPDGMTVDKEGCVWSARWDGWACIRYNTDGKPIQQIDFQARKISSVVFGGPEYQTMYFTSAADPSDTTEDNGRDGGKVFALESDVKGTPEFLSRILI
jgi:sugar lactone lactonase YvrE